MGLLDDALQVSGGLDRWRRLRRLTVHLSLKGALFNRMQGRTLMKGMVVEGGVHEQALEMTGFMAPDRRAHYRPDHVALVRSDGQLLEEQRATAAEFRRFLKASTWDALLLTFYCGSLIRNYLDVPFVLTDTDVVVREDRELRVLQVRFPERLAAHAAQTTLFFDTEAVLQRQVYTALHVEGMSIAQTYSGYQRYSGILIPTLCRLLLTNKNETAISPGPPLLDVEIFDAAFE